MKNRLIFPKSLTSAAVLTVMFLSAAVPQKVSADAYVDAVSRLRLASASSDSRLRLGVGGDEYEPSPDAAYIPAILCYDSDADLDALREMGVIVLRTRGGMALTYVPAQAVPIVQRSSFVSSMSVATCTRPALDSAVMYFDARLLHQATPEHPAYTGDGVVVGICDIGFDPLHPTFGNPGQSRVARVVQYMEQEGGRIVLNGESEYEEWVTDNPEEWHGTHVAGILTGDGAGSPYIGLAPDATLVATVSQLSDVGLLAGVEDVLEYAHLHDKPAVVNLSMGNYLGPHDGTSLFSQYMALLGEEGIICMSSGNEGDSSNTLSVTFNPELKSAAWRLNNMTWSNFDMYGMTDIWCADERPVRLRLGVCDGDDSKRIVAWSPEFIMHDGEMWSALSGEGLLSDFGAYFNGAFMITGGVDPRNNRYNVAVTFDFDSPERSSRGAWARYTLVMEISPFSEALQHVDVFADGQYSWLRELPGNPVPGSSFSVSDLCTGANVLSIGMYNNRNFMPSLGVGEVSTGYTAGEVCRHSGYGTLLDGTVLPHTIAPGEPLVSALSGAWAACHPDQLSGYASALTDFTGHPAYWIADGGTSMSSPYVAGAIACWLEANPNLDMTDVKDIVAITNFPPSVQSPALPSSSETSETDVVNPRQGQGWFNPVAGLLEAMRRSDSGGVTAASSCLSITSSPGIITVTNATSAEVEVLLYDMQGRVVMQHTVPHGVSDISTSGLIPGIYVATASGLRTSTHIKLRL